MIIIGIVKELTAPKVNAIPRTLKYAAHPAINNAEAPIIRVNKFIFEHFHIQWTEETRTYSH
tara:strand:+ start:96 stop:281 length:186 start_codon:yes stop_codon:yes gene_type:complete